MINTKEEFKRQHKKVVEEMKRLYVIWIESDEFELVKNYPDYLPSYDEFVIDFERIKPI